MQIPTQTKVWERDCTASRDYHMTKAMATQEGGESQAAAQSSESKERVTRANAEDYTLDKKDYTAVKVICLGDSAVGKSK